MNARDALLDIQHPIDLALRFVEGFDRAKFHDDTRTIYAVTRCLEDHLKIFLRKAKRADVHLEEPESKPE